MLDDRFYVTYAPISLADLIQGLAVSLPDPKFMDETISHAAQIAAAEPGSIVFLSSKKFLIDLDGCKATACFVTEKLASHVGERHIIPIISSAPRAHFARAMLRLGSKKTLATTMGKAQVATTARVHKSAVIGVGAVIGGGVIIGPHSVIGPGVEIGENSKIGPNTQIEMAVLGKNCVIKAGAVIGGRGFGVDKDEQGIIDIPHFGRVILGDGVQVGANSCVDRGQIGDTILGDNVKLDNLVQIGHNVLIGDGSRLAALTGISGSCVIGKNCMFGGAVGLADHLTIGDNVHIAARAGVMHNIPDGEFWGGTPAQPMKEFMREVATLRRLSRKPKKT